MLLRATQHLTTPPFILGTSKSSEAISLAMSNPYEVEHNIKPADAQPPSSRRPDMTTFFTAVSQISPVDESDPSQTHNNPHAVPRPLDLSTLIHLVLDQYNALLSSQSISTTQSSEPQQDFDPSDPSSSERAPLLLSLSAALESMLASPPTKIEGVSQAFLDGLDRVNKKLIKKEDKCPICSERFLDDKYPLVVRLPCHVTHWFDLECVGPWLRLRGTCPLDRKTLAGKRKIETEKKAAVEEDDYDGDYA